MEPRHNIHGGGGGGGGDGGDLHHLHRLTLLVARTDERTPNHEAIELCIQDQRNTNDSKELHAI